MAALSGSCSGDGGERLRSSADAAASTLANIGRAQRSRRCCVGVPILRRAQNGYVAQDVMRPYSGQRRRCPIAPFAPGARIE
jgi:hypothetical protein